MRYKIIFLVCIIGAVAAFLFKTRSSMPTVRLTQSGFYPAGLRIKVGTKVKFVTTINKPFWPASDLHPTHSIYPEFDPKGEIYPNSSWIFEFKKEGTFRYHDHVSAINRGTIVVVGDANFKSLSDCRKMSDKPAKKECFTDFLSNLILKKGPDYTFQVVDRLRREEPDFASECHNVAHDLGGIAYWKYAKDGKLPKTGSVSYCGFGFIHGFMTEYGHHARDFVGGARGVCDYFSKKLNYDNFEKMISPFDQCYHGVGHGLAYFYIPEFGNNTEEVIKRGAKDCEDVASDSYAVSNCKFGLFGGVGSVYLGGHGFVVPLDSGDPLKICKKQSEDLAGACYDSMVPVVGVIYGDIDKLIKLFKSTPGQYKDQIFYSIGDLASRWLSEGRIKSESLFMTCESVGDVGKSACFKGFVQGIVRNIFPESIQNEVESFCSYLEDAQKTKCFQDVRSEMQLIYPKDN